MNVSPQGAVELVAIVNSFNRRALLERAIRSLFAALREGRIGSAVVVFEAGSNDGSREFLETWQRENPGDPLLVIAPQGAKSSFSDGVNSACATALEKFSACRWLFLYETDNALHHAAPLTSAISLLAQESQLAAAGFTVALENGERVGYGMRFPGALSLALGQNISYWLNLHRPNSSPWRDTGGVRWRECDVVFTSPLLIRREAWEQSGGFDAEAFPFSDSDLDWAWRCAKLGWKMAVIEGDGVVHDNFTQMSAWSTGRVLDFHRSRMRLLRRYRGATVALIKPLLFARHALELLLLRARRDPSAAAKIERRRQLLGTVWSDYE
ncbi:MAG: glycosyltransferase [Verrucomicrobiota bacterium]|nr:glycosyltransferase [Verrucomicrobiota bacterium]